MAQEQLLHLVIGGVLDDVEHVTFRDPSKIHFVGAYPSYAEALKAWRGASQSSVDNALMRYFIIHAHKLLDPEADGHAH